MKIKIGLLRQNPFKKHINDGKLNEDRLEVLKESVEHGTLPEFFVARRYNGKYEISYGHHRLEVLRQMKGDDYEVEVNVVDYSDEQMLVDMVRENITQRDTDFRDTYESILLAQGWLQSKSVSVKQFNKNLTLSKRGIKEGRPQGSNEPDSYRSIAKFISKKGKTISYATVKNYLDIHNKLKPELRDKVKKYKGNENTENGLTLREALMLTGFEEDEQDQVLEVLREQDGATWQKTGTINKLKNAPEEIRKKVYNKEISVEDVEDETDKKLLKDEVDKRPKTIFIPNFEQRLKQFSRDVGKLEKQVIIFSKIFHSNDFNKRYYTLKPKQQQKLNDLIFNIKGRIEQCYNEINFYIQKLDGNILLGDEEK